MEMMLPADDNRLFLQLDCLFKVSFLLFLFQIGNYMRKMDLWKIVISYRVDEMGQGVCLVFDTMLFHRLGCYAGNTF